MINLSGKNPMRVNNGQMRVFEAIAATIVIFSAFSIAIYLIYPFSLWTVYEKEDLDRFGYNVLNNLIESGAVESILKESDDNVIKVRLKTFIDGIIPSMMYYNLKILVREEGNIGFHELISISNAPSKVFMSSPQTSSTTAIYTSREGKAYYLILILVKGGENA